MWGIKQEIIQINNGRMQMRVPGAGCRGSGLWDFGFRISDFGFRIWDLGFGIWDLRFGICDLRFAI
jgi:hypothetical protein